MKRRVHLFVLLLTVAAIAWLGSGGSDTLPGQYRGELERWVFVGAPLMEVQIPSQDFETPLGSVEVLVTFVGGTRVAVGTFQCLLNDRDVTSTLTLGRNGAAGSIFGLHEGENEIVLRVFGKTWWGRAGFVQEQRARIVRVRPLQFLDVA